MASFIEIVVSAAKAVARQQPLLLANLTGNVFLAFAVFAWHSFNGGFFEDLASSVFMSLMVGFFTTWLAASTLAAFHPGVTADTPFIPVLRRLHFVLPWAAALVGTLFLFHWMSSLLGFLVWTVGTATILALLPMASQAAGAGFSRQCAADIVFNENYWIASIGLVIVGFYLPISFFYWMPMPENPLVRLVAGGARIGVACLLSVSAWVLLAALIGELARRGALPKKSPQAAEPANPMQVRS
jgi:hypothetical protein